MNGLSFDGGYAEYVLLREEAVVRVPKDVDAAQVAPLLCAGVTTFNAMRKQHVEQGNLVAVQGLGGLGHLAVQYANKMGYRTVAISSGSSKRDFARELGAHEYIDTSEEDPSRLCRRWVAPQVSELLSGLFYYHRGAFLSVQDFFWGLG